MSRSRCGQLRASPAVWRLGLQLGQTARLPSVLPICFALLCLFLAARAIAVECALVATSGFDAVTVVDLASGDVTARIPTAEYTVSVVVGADGRTAYAANAEDNSVSVIDLAPGIVTATISVGASPLAIAPHPDGQRLHVVERNAGRISVVDLTRGAVVGAIVTGGTPTGIAATRDGRLAYVAEFFSSRVAVLDLDQERLITWIAAGEQPFDLALSPDEKTLYVANVTSADVTVIDTAARRRVTSIPVGGFPSGVAFHPSRAFAYVSDAPEGGVTVIDTERNVVETSFRFHEGFTLNASAVAMTPDGATALVPDFVYGNLYFIDTATHTVRNFFPLGSSSAGPQRLAVASLATRCPRPPMPRLAADLTPVGTEMKVDRLDALPISGTVRIDGEVITFRSQDLTAHTVRELGRGIHGTSPAEHASGTLVLLIRPGDANCDARISAADPVAIARAIATGGEPGPCGDDLNGDGLVEPRDLDAALVRLFSPADP